MNVLLLPWGTLGDVYPHIGLGIALRDRGHHVTLIANQHFEPLARANGFTLVETGSEEQYHNTWGRPDIWHPRKGRRPLAQWASRSMPAQFGAIADAYKPGNTVVAASCCAIGARIAHEKLGVPLASLILQPFWFEIAQIPDWLPAWMRGRLCRVLDLAIRKTVGMDVSRFRAQLGLAPAKWLERNWWLSPHRAIGMFPAWYAPPREGWPAQVRLTGFPLFEGCGGPRLPGDLESFLQKGEPPIVFTVGSEMRHGQRYWGPAIEACQALGQRGILLTRYADQLPDSLPPDVRHVDYAPLSLLLPNTAAIVHHGGIGTTGQAMAAGVPQLITPMIYDQPDNAERVKRLGIGDFLGPRSFQKGAVIRKLRGLLESSGVTAKCRAIAEKFEDTDPFTETCALVEQLAGSDGTPEP